ncbi:MAG: hypothetical protein ACTHUU_16570, partial [Brachybacterium sp.]
RRSFSVGTLPVVGSGVMSAMVKIPNCMLIALLGRLGDASRLNYLSAECKPEVTALARRGWGDGPWVDRAGAAAGVMVRCWRGSDLYADISAEVAVAPVPDHTPGHGGLGVGWPGIDWPGLLG